MKKVLGMLTLFAFLMAITVPPRIAASQESPTGASASEQAAPESAAEDEELKDQAGKVAAEAHELVEQITDKVDESQKAGEVSAGILKPVYMLAEYLSFPAFHWVAFALMLAGVVSFGLQLVLAKLVVLTKMGLSITEILSDALGLAISLVGLVLTTQAAAENSDFTTSPAAVLSAVAVGGFTGFIFYWWGQAHEVAAVEGRRKQKQKQKS